jgi:tagatose-1,6-bisphosphate aldolase non-catalytic subunit AgaZ/GatZ
VDRYIKQIQTRVNRQLKIHNQSVTKQQIRDVYSQIVKNPVQPTTREITQVTELLAQQFSVTEKTIEIEQEKAEETEQTLAKIPAHLYPFSAQNQSPTTTEIKRENTPDMWETLPLAEQPLEPQSVALTQTESELATPPSGILHTETEQTTESELATPPSGILHTETEQTVELAIRKTGESNNIQTNLPTHQPTVGANITQTEITSAIAMAVKQVGENGNTEAIQLLTSLAEELSSDISDTQEMVAALVSAYLDKRQSVLSSAIGTLNTLRLAQTSSFQSGLNNDFFAQKTRSKRQFLTQIETMFN